MGRDGHQDLAGLRHLTFVEATYDLIPDTLKFIAGARFNDDRSSALVTPVAVGGLLLANGFVPIGTPSCAATFVQTTPLTAGCVGWPGTFRLPTGITGKQNNTTDKWTGRMSLNWTPHLSWTDSALAVDRLELVDAGPAGQRRECLRLQISGRRQTR